MTDTETKAANAITDMAIAEAQKAAAIEEEAKAQAAQSLSTAAETATAAAQAGAALAEANAAKIIEQDKEEKTWLKTNLESQGVSLQNLANQQTELAAAIPSLLEQNRNQTLEAVRALLTQSKSESEPTSSVQPTQESAEEDARREAEKKKKKKPARNWL